MCALTDSQEAHLLVLPYSDRRFVCVTVIILCLPLCKHVFVSLTSGMWLQLQSLGRLMSKKGFPWGETWHSKSLCHRYAAHHRLLHTLILWCLLGDALLTCTAAQLNGCPCPLAVKMADISLQPAEHRASMAAEVPAPTLHCPA